MPRLLLLFVFVLPLGCSQTDYPNVTYPVTGRLLTKDGAPAAGVRVTLHSSHIISEGDPFRPSGTSDQDGLFQLTTYETDDGAPAGNYAMTFRWAPPQKTLLDPTPKDRLKNRFAVPNDESLTCEIIDSKEPQDIGTFEIDVKKLSIERMIP